MALFSPKVLTHELAWAGTLRRPKHTRKGIIMPTISGPIRVTIPVNVAANIKTLKTSLQSVAERLGCKACFSGADCFFELERQYLIDEKAKLAARVQVPDRGAVDLAARNVGTTVRVGLSSKAGYSIDTITAAVEKIAELSGHVACATGCNLFFEHFLDDMRSFVVGEKGLMQRF